MNINQCLWFLCLQIDPDIDADQSEHPERKKLKLKEIYLTKLLSTKVGLENMGLDELGS